MDKIKGALAERPREYAALLCAEGTGHECTEEYVLPDYMPPVQRIVSVTARPLPDGKFISADTVELSGTVAYTVIYADSDGTLTGFSPSGDYSVTVPFTGDENGYVSAETKAVSVSCRATAPRKLTLKARLQSTVRCIGMRTAELEMSGADSGGEKAATGLQRLEKQHRTMETGGGVSCVSFSGTIRGAGGLTPLYCDGVPCITEAKADQDCVNVRGELYVKCTCRDDEGALVTLGDRITFEDIIDSSGASADTAARCWGRCASLTVTPSEDGSSLNCTGEIDLECEWMRQACIGVVEDMYSSRGECETATEKIELLEGIVCSGSRLTVSERFPCTSAQGDKAVSCTAAAEISSADAEDGRIYLTGTCTVKVVIAGTETSEREFALPFKCRFDPVSGGEIPAGELIYRADAAVIDASARLDGAEADVSAELYISLGASVKKPVNAIVKASLCDGEDTRGDKIRVCYVSGGESMWDIGKKYRVPIDDLRRLNGDEVGKFVIIDG